MVEWKVTNIREGTDYDRDRGFYRFKIVDFEVDGSTHTIRVSMPDFDKGNIPDIVKKEVDKILSGLQVSGSGKTGK